jgi:putative endonuclease
MAKEDLTLRATAGRPAFEFNAFVYLLTSQSRPDQQYVGSTDNLRKRFTDHNWGGSPHTAKFRPWVLVAYFAFVSEKRAIAFEKYLKVGLRKGIRQAAFSLMSFGAQRQAQAVRRSHSTVSDGPRSKLRLAPSR